MNKIFNIQNYLFYDSLPKSKPFQSYNVFIKQRDPGMRNKVPSLLCIALPASCAWVMYRNFKMAAQKHAQFQLVVS